jgi:hypothetical protein
MLELSDDRDLTQKAVGPERGGELGVKYLDRDGAAVTEVLCQVDRGHPPASKLALERVAAAQGVRE